MSAQENVRTVEAFFDAFNTGDWDRWAELHAVAVVHDGPDHKEPIRGRDAVRTAHEGIGQAFPDFRWEPVRIFAKDDLVCAECTLSGTHQGPVPLPNGEMLEPTNKRFEMPSCLVFRIENGEIAEYTGYGDFLSFYAQLGVVVGERPGVAAKR